MIRNRRNILKNLLLVVLAILIYDGGSELYFLGTYAFLPGDMLENHYFMLDTFFCTIVLVLFAIWLELIKKHRLTAERIMAQPINLTDGVTLVLGMGGIASIWFILVDTVLESLTVISDSLQSFNDTWSTVETESYLWVFLSVVIVGPIAEELMFRGIIFHHLEQVKPGWFPILASGICFGLWHQEPVQVVYTGIMGVILGLVYVSCRDLKIVIGMHVLNNFLSTLPPFLDTPAIQDAIYYTSLVCIIPTAIMLKKMAKDLQYTQLRQQFNSK